MTLHLLAIVVCRPDPTFAQGKMLSKEDLPVTFLKFYHARKLLLYYYCADL